MWIAENWKDYEVLDTSKGEKLERKALFWHYPHYGNQGGAPGSAIRRGDFKLIEWNEDDKVELYNVSIDPGEKEDVAAEQPALSGKLRAELHQWQKDVGAKPPTVNPGYDTAKPSGRAVAKKQ